jgi:site-specific DNA-methyltransferase (adenine-specific)
MISHTENIDCMDFMRTIPDGFFDLVIADPPYGIGQDWKKSTNRTYDFKETSYKNGEIPEPKFFKELFRVSKNQIIWGANYYSHILPPTNNLIVWDKRGDCLLNFTSDGELAWTSITRYPFRIITSDWSGARKGKETGQKKHHPHQKPVDLYLKTLKEYAKPGHKIFDPMMGSQSSRIAAHDLGFDYWGCEKDVEYYVDGEARFQEHIKKPLLFAPKQMYDFKQTELFQ